MLTRTWPPQGQGGLAAAASDLAGAMVCAGASVEVLTPGGGAPPSMQNEAGVRVHALAAPAGRYSTAWWRQSLAFYRAMRPAAVDVVLGVSAAANALAAQHDPGRPAFVFRAHGTSVGEVASKLRSGRARSLVGLPRNVYWGLARDRAYRDYDAVVAVGEAVRRQLSAWPTASLVADVPVTLIRNGVDAGAFRFDPLARRRLRAGLRLDDDAPMALFAGRLQADKGPQRALRALQRALATRPELTLVMAGEGPERSALERLAAELGVQAKVRLLGPLSRDALKPWFSAADALLFPTRRAEGLPLVVLEALACGLPVITTPEGAADAELPCQRLPAHDLSSFAAALHDLRPHQPRSSRLPAPFELEYSARAYLALFEALIANSSAARAA